MYSLLDDVQIHCKYIANSEICIAMIVNDEYLTFYLVKYVFACCERSSADSGDRARMDIDEAGE